MRNSFTKRGSLYSQFGVSIRCARDDQSSQTIYLHYLNDGTVNLRFHHRKQEYLIPLMLILKALAPISDKEAYDLFLQGNYDNTFLTERVEILLRSYQKYNLYTQDQALSYLGSRFRVALGSDKDMTDCQVGTDLLNKVLFVHLNKSSDKANLLV